MKERLPAQVSSDGFYHAYVSDRTRRSGRKQVKAKTISGLKTKISTHNRIRFKDAYRITQEEKQIYCKGEKALSVTNTVTRNLQNYQRFFGGTDFENMLIDEITEQDIEDEMLKILRQYDLRKAAYQSMCTIIRTAFTYAYRHRYACENIAARVDFGHPKFQSMLADDVDIEDRLYTDDEIRRMLTYCHIAEEDKHEPVVYALEFQILTAVRRAEVCPLKWSDIKSDGSTAYIEIRRELIFVKRSKVNEHSYSQIVEHTKTYKSRRIPIWDELADFLRRLRRAHEFLRSDSEFLFPQENDLGCLNISAVYKRYGRMCRKIGVPVISGVIRGTHAFRRNFAKRINDAELASKLLGNSEKVLRKNYYDGLDLMMALSALEGNQKGNQG